MASRLISVMEAADALGLPVSGVEALADAGYLHLDGQQGVSLSEIKAFQARNASGAGDTAADLLGDIGAADEEAEALLDALEASVGDMADRAADIMAATFPETAGWTGQQRRRFVRQARLRFEAIVTVTRAETADEELLEDLADAGGAAAFAGAPLPQVLLTLRISRDLLVQSAVAAAAELGQQRSVALAVVLTRVLPVLDRLTDAVARGYWRAVRMREQEVLSRYAHMVEHAGHGVYEVELDGSVCFANSMLARIADDLHDVSRIRADALSLMMRRVDIAPACAAATRMLPGAEAVEVDVPADLEVVADGRRLQHVIAHLVENGLRHGRPPVVLRARAVDGAIQIEVLDHGDGVALHHVEGLFASLVPSAADGRLRDRPSGLGLPLARSLVEAMGGRIRHDRLPEGTTRFRVTLPT
jgi:signal transduction histidine kinase